MSKKICEIRDEIDQRYLKIVLECIYKYMPKDIMIWTGVINIENSHKYIEENFVNPLYVEESPLKFNFDKSGISFSKKNTMEKEKDKSTIKNKLLYAFGQKEDICNIYVKFRKDTIKKLKKMNEKSEKELAGSLIVDKVIKKGEKIVFELTLNDKSISKGEEEEVEAVFGRYNFHSHPGKAYKNNNVTNGWPSSTDYVGFLQLNHDTIFHTVITLEGLYIISLSPVWKGDIKKINKDEIYKKYDIDHNKKISFEEYTKQINDIKYKGKQLFVVKYLSWKKSDNVFAVHYKKINNKCLTSDKELKIYK